MTTPLVRKPPYRVPSMAEIAAVPATGFTVASTFSGCGGSSLGYRLAGFRVVWANEFIEAARASYAANAPTTPIDPRDIRVVTGRDLEAATGLARGALDVLDGSPPCASFSSAGKLESHWGQARPYSETTQRTDDLFFEFARLVDEIAPRVFVAENVAGLVRGVAKGTFKRVLATLRACGYRVAARVLDAQWLGVPQQRQRLFFVGVRDDLGLDPAFPSPLPYRYSVRDALPHIARLQDTFWHSRWLDGSSPAPAMTATRTADALVVKGGRRSLDRPAPTVQTHGRAGTESELTVGILHRGPQYEGMIVRPLDKPSPTIRLHHDRMVKLVVEPETDISRFAIAREWDMLKPGESSAKYFNLVKPALDAPCPTLTIPTNCAFSPTALHGAATVCHPIERRKFAIAELKRICAFPDDFVLTGTYNQQWERLGRAVPPLMMAALATAIRDAVLVPARARPTGGPLYD